MNLSGIYRWKFFVMQKAYLTLHCVQVTKFSGFILSCPNTNAQHDENFFGHPWNFKWKVSFHFVPQWTFYDRRSFFGDPIKYWCSCVASFATCLSAHKKSPGKTHRTFVQPRSQHRRASTKHVVLQKFTQNRTCIFLVIRLVRETYLANLFSKKYNKAYLATSRIFPRKCRFMERKKGYLRQHVQRKRNLFRIVQFLLGIVFNRVFGRCARCSVENDERKSGEISRRSLPCAFLLCDRCGLMTSAFPAPTGLRSCLPDFGFISLHLCLQLILSRPKEIWANKDKSSLVLKISVDLIHRWISWVQNVHPTPNTGVRYRPASAPIAPQLQF